MGIRAQLLAIAITLEKSDAALPIVHRRIFETSAIRLAQAAA